MNDAQDRMRAMPGIRATQITAAPEWALVQRQLLTTIEAAGDLSVEWFEDAAGNEHFVHDVDDVYESRRADPSNVHAAARSCAASGEIARCPSTTTGSIWAKARPRSTSSGWPTRLSPRTSGAPSGLLPCT